ncbi:hypothetical protein HY251_04305 [bacterium]|nr:hypothetical protein [bacterium]
MPSYEVAGHVVDHPPFFACRKHKALLRMNRAFVEEMLAWAPELQPQNLTEVAASALGGDDKAFLTSDYLIPPKVSIFNPRKVQGHGSLPFLIVFIDKRFFGIPASYLRRRFFEGCTDCQAENDPTSDASFPDYKPPAPPPPKPRTQAVPGAAKPVTKSLAPPKDGPPGTPGPAPRPPAGAPPQRKTGAIPKPGAAPPQTGTRSIPKKPPAPSYDVPPVEREPPPR